MSGLGSDTAPKLPRRTGNAKPLFDGPEWSFDLIRDVDAAMGEIALGEMGLSIYPNQIEVITAEQMLDALWQKGYTAKVVGSRAVVTLQ